MTAPDLLEERLVDALQDALHARHDAAEWPEVAGLTLTEANAAVIAAARALLAASGTGERPADEVDRLKRLLADQEAMHQAYRPEVVAEVAVQLTEDADWDLIAERCGGRVHGQTLPSGDYSAYIVTGRGEVAHEGMWITLGHDGIFRVRGEIQAPTPPDAGTGTPSDDGREFVRVFAVLDDSRPGHPNIATITAQHATAVAVAEDIAARHPRKLGGMVYGWVVEPPFNGPNVGQDSTPAAPSGTTGATTGERCEVQVDIGAQCAKTATVVQMFAAGDPAFACDEHAHVFRNSQPIPPASDTTDRGKG